MEVMESDKKVIEGKLRFVLMKEIGSSQVVGEVDRRTPKSFGNRSEPTDSGAMEMERRVGRVLLRKQRLPGEGDCFSRDAVSSKKRKRLPTMAIFNP